jgi:hypothetical protein
MNHAESSIIWFVAPYDFFGIIMPEMLNLTLAAITISAYQSIPDYSIGTAGDFTGVNIFKFLKKPPCSIKDKKWEENILCKLKLNKIQFTVSSIEEDNIDNFHFNYNKYILPALIKTALYLINHHNVKVSNSNIDYGYNRLKGTYLNNSLPHLEAFGNSKVYKQRLIFLGEGFDGDNKTNWIKERIEKYWMQYTVPHLKSKFGKEVVNNVFKSKLFKESLNLFIRTCNSSHNIKVIGKHSEISSLNDSETIDFGIYDNIYFVSSRTISTNSKTETESRQVSWYYVPNEIEGESSFTASESQIFDCIKESVKRNFSCEFSLFEIAFQDFLKKYDKRN